MFATSMFSRRSAINPKHVFDNMIIIWLITIVMTFLSLWFPSSVELAWIAKFLLIPSATYPPFMVGVLIIRLIMKERSATIERLRLIKLSQDDFVKAAIRFNQIPTEQNGKAMLKQAFYVLSYGVSLSEVNILFSKQNKSSMVMSIGYDFEDDVDDIRRAPVKASLNVFFYTTFGSTKIAEFSMY